MTFLRLEKIFILGFCLCAMMICLTACRREEIVYNIEETGTGEEGETSVQLQNGIPQHIEDSLISGAGEITVNADVLNTESYGELPVAIMEIKDWSEEDIKNYAEAVFDKGSAEVVLPIARWSKEKLLDEEAEVQEKIKELGYTAETIYNNPDYMYLGNKLDEIHYYLKDYNENDVLENDGRYKWISSEVFVRESDEEMCEMLTCQVKGTIGGQTYCMYVRKWGYDLSCNLMIFPEKGEYFAESTLSFITAERVAPDTPIGADNICTITEQEAVQQAEAFVNQLGIQGLAVSDTYQARVYTYKLDEETGDGYSEQETKGYLVYFGRTMGGCSTPCVDSYLQTECVGIKEEHIDGRIQYTDGERSYGYEGVTVWVTDDGVEQFQYLNPMEVTEIAAERAEVIDFEQAYESAMKYMQEKGYNDEIDKIRLCMGRVQYEDSYALVPVWCYEYDASYNDVDPHRDAVLVNAIDGSIIEIDSGRPVE